VLRDTFAPAESRSEPLLVVWPDPIRAYARSVSLRRALRRRASKEPSVSIGDPRLESWETVTTFEDQGTAMAWRDQLRSLGVDAACTADHPLDRFGHGDIYLVVPPHEYSRASEIIENLD
jgi:hypothetical protein